MSFKLEAQGGNFIKFIIYNLELIDKCHSEGHHIELTK